MAYSIEWDFVDSYFLQRYGRLDYTLPPDAMKFLEFLKR